MARLRSGIKWLLFLSSYIPLFLLLTIKHWGIKRTFPEIDFPVVDYLGGMSFPVISVVWIVLMVLSGLALWLVISLKQSRGGTDFKPVESFRSRDDLVTNYILVYIFPFVVLDYTNLANWLAFLVFFGVIGIIQVRSNLLHINPILAIFDYQVYEVDTGEQVLTVVSKSDISPSDNALKTVELSNDVFLTV